MSYESLKAKLALKQRWINTRYDYYEQKNMRPDPSRIIPRSDKYNFNSVLGWCTDAVDDLANRLCFWEFDRDSDAFNINEIFNYNSQDILLTSAIRSALISACCFIYISTDEDGYPRLQAIDGRHATGEIDPITFLLREGYAVLDTDDNGEPTIEAYFAPEYTDIIERGYGAYRIPNPTGYPLLVPVIYRPDAKRPFGQSRISKSMMDIMDKARFTITRAEIASEFGSIPQKYAVGLDPELDFDPLANTYKTILAIDKDQDGEKPTLGQFAQFTAAGHLSQFELYREEFLRQAGMSTPEKMTTLANNAQKSFGSCFLNVGLVAASLRDGTAYKRREVYKTEPVWMPAYGLDPAVMSGFGDGIIKISQSVPDAFTAKTIKRMTGLPIEVG